MSFLTATIAESDSVAFNYLSIKHSVLQILAMYISRLTFLLMNCQLAYYTKLSRAIENGAHVLRAMCRAFAVCTYTEHRLGTAYQQILILCVRQIVRYIPYNFVSSIDSF